MKKSLLTSMLEFAGFAIIAFLFGIWFLGSKKNNLPDNSSANEQIIISAADVGNKDQPERGSVDYTNSGSYTKSNDYQRQTYELPEKVSAAPTAYASIAAPERSSKRKSSTVKVASVGKRAKAVRSWKGVHRDESFAWLCFDRFGAEVVELSEKYGLYPDVFMARIIAYSFEYTNDPRVDPSDKNFTGLPEPKSRSRAIFRSASESLKAYAVFHAGELKQLSKEGAMGKNDRAWSMNKIIDNYAFVKDLAKDAPERSAYKGRVGSSNRVAEEKNYQREMVGEAVRMVSSVDNVVKKRRAGTAGYSNWEDYLESLPEDVRAEETDNAASATSAISKKKAFNLSRRVDAKKRKKN